MIPHPFDRIIAFVVTALITFCYMSGKEARAQAGTSTSLQTRAASRLERTQTKVDNEKAQPLMDEGLRRAEQKDWAGALEAFNKALAISPRYGDLYIAMGDTYMNMGKYKEGFNAYQQAISVAPSNPVAHYSLGAAYNDMAQYGDAFKHFVQAIRLDSNFAEAHYGIGYAYLKIDRFKDALSYLRRAVQLWPDSVEIHLALGQTYIGLRDMKGAERELKILTGLDASAAGRLEKEFSAARNNAELAQTTAPAKSPGTPAGAAAQTQSKSSSLASLLNPRPRVPSSDADLAIELSFWESVKNSSIPEEFAAYLNKYPEGQFAELARIRLHSLAGDVKPAKEVPKEQPTPETTPPDETPANVDSVEAALDSLRKLLASTFSYQIRATGEASGSGDSTLEVKINYEPLKFEGCTVKWRDQTDTLWVSLTDLDPEAVRVEPRSRPNTTFSIEVWNLSMTAVDGKNAINEAKGDGSNTVNQYNGLDLQYDRKEKAETLAGVLRQAIRLCRGKSPVTAQSSAPFVLFGSSR